MTQPATYLMILLKCLSLCVNVKIRSHSLLRALIYYLKHELNPECVDIFDEKDIRYMGLHGTQLLENYVKLVWVLL